MTLTWLDGVVLALYFLCLTAMGLVLGKAQRSREEYQLGGRRVHWALAGASLLATLLSTVSFVALPGEMVRHGPTLFVSLLALPFTVAVIGRVLIPTFKALPYTSAYQYLDNRFGSGVRRLAAAVFVARTVIWMGLITYTCCLVVTAVTGWSFTSSVFLVGLGTTVYATAGGFRTVVYADAVQLVVLFAGALAIPVMVVATLHTGPVDWWHAMAQAGHTRRQIFSFDPTVRTTLLGVILARFFWAICTHGSDQVAVQRYLSTPSPRAARRTLWTAACAEVVLLSLLMLAGMALFAFYHDRSGLDAHGFLATVADSADQLLPRFIVEELPPGVSGLMLAALLAAAMSSLSSGISAISSVAVGDLATTPREAREGGTLRWDRTVAVLAGLAGVALALAIGPIVADTGWNLVDVMERLNHIFVGPLAVLFFSGILFVNVGVRAGLAGFVSALAWSLVISVPGGWLGIGQDISFMWIVAVPFLVGMGVAWLSARCGGWAAWLAATSRLLGGSRRVSN